MKKFKIVFVLERLGNGGAERVTAELANYFSLKEIAEVHVFTYVKEEHEYNLDINVHRHLMNKKRKGKFSSLFEKIRFLSKGINGISPDVVISLATPKTSGLLTMLSLRRKYTLILSERNDPAQYPKETIYRVLRNFSYMACDGVVFQTNDAKEYFKKLKVKTSVIANPISTDLPKRHRTDAREKRVVNFCRLEKQKNIPLLIDAFQIFSNIYPDYVLELYGEGDQKESLQKYANNIGIGEKVKFNSFSSNIHNEIINAAMFVSSSDYEGISNSMLEALAIGLPTVCTDCPIGGARMIIEDQVNGLLVPTNNKDKLAEAMLRMINDDILRIRCESNAACVRVRYSVDAIGNKWVSFIHQCIGEEYEHN